MLGWLAASGAEWLGSGGSLLAAFAAIILSLLAYRQMKASRVQARAASDQVEVMRADADEGRKRRAEQDERLVEQIAAVAGIADETRAAARAQLQPIVFAHALGAHARGPNDNFDISAGQLAFPYRLANEGTGIALNIRHGVEIDGAEFEFGDGMKMRVLRSGEEWPLRDPATAKLVQIRPFAAIVNDHELPETWPNVTPVYWTRFENVFGERFMTRNPADPRISASFQRT
jgi:hypothetical protein